MKFAKFFSVFSIALIGIIAIAESFVPNSQDTYGGWYVETDEGVEYRGIGEASSCGIASEFVDAPYNYGYMMRELDEYNQPKLAGPKLPSVATAHGQGISTHAQHPGLDNSLPTVKKPVLHQQRIIYHNGCGTVYYRNYNCGWRHANYQRCQPIRNVARFFHNRRPVRRFLGRIFCGRRCW